LRALAIDYQLLPVAFVPGDGRSDRRTGLPTRRDGAGDPSDAAKDIRLQAGDRVTTILALSDLQRFLQRDQVPRDCAAEVTELPATARAFIGKLLQSIRALDAEAAEKSLDELPLRLATRLTRGQAEELLELLRQERVSGRLRLTDGA